MATCSFVQTGPRRPPWLVVPATFEAQARAVRSLVRGDEVARLARALDPRDLAWAAAGWLRACRATGALRYAADPPGADVWRSPACTLRDGGGDCEDFAILAAAMLADVIEGEVDVVVGLYDLEPHAWVEGRDRAGYFLLEATRGELYDRPNPSYEARRRFPV